MLMGAARLRSPPPSSAPLRRIQATASLLPYAANKPMNSCTGTASSRPWAAHFFGEKFAGDGGLSPRVAASAMSPPVNI